MGYPVYQEICFEPKFDLFSDQIGMPDEKTGWLFASILKFFFIVEFLVFISTFSKPTVLKY